MGAGGIRERHVGSYQPHASYFEIDLRSFRTAVAFEILEIGAIRQDRGAQVRIVEGGDGLFDGGAIMGVVGVRNGGQAQQHGPEHSHKQAMPRRG